MNARFFSGAIAQGRQRGAVLIVSLIILMMMSLLGLANIRSAATEERVAGNVRDYQAALQAAESGLRAGEGWLNASVANRATAATHTPISDLVGWDGGGATLSRDLRSETDSPLNSNPVAHVSPPVLLRHATDANLNQSEIRCRQIFTVSAYSSGISADSEVILQSTYDPPASGLILCPAS